MNTVNYVNCRAVDPDYYDRRYDFDYKPSESTFSRISSIALPFIALDPALGAGIGFFLNIRRTYSNGVTLFYAEFLSYDQFVSFTQTTLAVMSIAGTVFSFKLGMIVTSLADTMQSMKNVYEAISKGERKRALNEIVQTAGSFLYFATMYYASLEIVLASLVVKALICLLESADELYKERYPEFVAKLAMCVIRLNDAHGKYKEIERRDYLNGLKRYQDLLQKIAKSKELDPLYNHPLIGIHEKAEAGAVIFTDNDGNVYDFGAQFSEFGGPLVKGMNLSAKKYDGYTELEFKINHVHREKIQENIKTLIRLQRNPDELREVLDLNKSGIEDIYLVNHSSFPTEKPHYQIMTDTGCKVHLGSDPELINSYDKVTITIPEGKSLYDAHKVLALTGLDSALRESSAEDMERMKIGHLFHTLSPRAAYTVERKEEFFALPNEELKQRIIELDPSMEAKMDVYLDKMTLKDTLPGRKRLHIEGLAEELEELGDFTLTTLLTGTGSEEESFSRVASILNMGFVSKEMRDKAGASKNGLVTDYDFSGGSDSTFVQAFTSEDFFHSGYYDNFSNHPIRFIFDPKILESGTYQYADDAFGHRLEIDSKVIEWWGLDPTTSYDNRDAIDTFLEKQITHNTYGNEIMIKDCIPPEYITGIVVRDEEMKENLLDYMRFYEHLEGDLLFGRRVDDFVRVI